MNAGCVGDELWDGLLLWASSPSGVFGRNFALARLVRRLSARLIKGLTQNAQAVGR